MSKPSLSKIVKERVKENPQSLGGALTAGLISALLPLIHKFLNTWGRRQVLKFLNWVSSFSAGGAVLVENYSVAIVTGILALAGFLLEVAASRVAEMTREPSNNDTDTNSGIGSGVSLVLLSLLAGALVFATGCEEVAASPANTFGSSGSGHTTAPAEVSASLWQGPPLLGLFVGAVLYLLSGCYFVFSGRQPFTFRAFVVVLLWPLALLLFLAIQLLLRLDDRRINRRIAKGDRDDYFGNFALIALAAVLTLSQTSCSQDAREKLGNRIKAVPYGVYGVISGKELCVCIGKTGEATEPRPEDFDDSDRDAIREALNARFIELEAK